MKSMFELECPWGFSLMDVRNATPPILDDQVIHRSRKTRAAFYDAAIQTDGEVISLLQLMKSMFELGFLDVSDMRWRALTKTFRKNGE